MLSIIIAVLNENNGILNKTINSILENSPSNIEIIVVDDCSDNQININNNKNVILHRNEFRIGAAQSKHLGICLSSKKYIFLTDAHVLFDKDYYNNVIKSLENKPSTLFCGTCLGLSEEKFNLLEARGAYVGAKLFLYDEKENQILDGKWISDKKDENNYEISCVMGANYFMHKEHFFKIRGFSELKSWGSEEPCLSIKTWLSGGEVLINKNVKTGHMFRNVAPYRTFTKDIIYNKLRMSQSFLPEHLSRYLISKLSQGINFFEAFKMINKDYKSILEHKNYYNNIFTRDIYWLCDKFNIEIPHE